MNLLLCTTLKNGVLSAAIAVAMLGLFLADSRSSGWADNKELTFTKDVAPIFYKHYSSFRGELEGPEQDMTSVAVTFARQPPAQRVMTLTVQNHFFRNPPGAKSRSDRCLYLRYRCRAD